MAIKINLSITQQNLLDRMTYDWRDLSTKRVTSRNKTLQALHKKGLIQLRVDPSRPFHENTLQVRRMGVSNLLEKRADLRDAFEHLLMMLPIAVITNNEAQINKVKTLI